MLAQQRNVCLRVCRRAAASRNNRGFNVAPPSFRASSTLLNTVDGSASSMRSTDIASHVDTRAHFGVSAADDFVHDYRELANLPIWSGLLASESPDFRVLDVCCGTGRWAQAFSELVLKRRNSKVPCDFIDLCPDSINVLGQRLGGLSNLNGGTRFTGDICKLNDIGVPTLSYDLIANMHGLYGVPKEVLPSALQSMYDALKPGGTMILAIGSESSPYQQVPRQCLGVHVTDDIDIARGFTELGIQANISHIAYSEEYAETDQVSLDRFLMDECGGNCFPTDVALDLNKPASSVQEFAADHFDTLSRTYRFHHVISVITVQRDARPVMRKA